MDKGDGNWRAEFAAAYARYSLFRAGTIIQGMSTNLIIVARKAHQAVASLAIVRTRQTSMSYR